MKKAGFVYLLEGFMDVIAMYKAGIENTVAIMGTALTKGHIQALRRLTNHIYLCFCLLYTSNSINPNHNQ